MSGFERWSKARRARIAFDDIAKDWLSRAGADIPTSRKVDAPPTSSSALPTFGRKIRKVP